MVLRKQPPPHLEYPGKEVGRFDPHPSISPTAKAASPKRPTRPRRAQSSPQPRQFPSQESVYSPDLNTSPAFDLMPLEQAQRSPAGTASSDPQNPWADELVEKPDQYEEPIAPGPTPVNRNEPQEGTATDRNRGDRVPPIVRAGTQRRLAANEWQPDEGANEAPEWEQTPVQLKSNNPFLKTKQSEDNPWQSDSYQNQQGEELRDSRTTSLLPEDGSDALSQSEGYIPMTARLSLLDQPPSDPWAEERPVSSDHHLDLDPGTQAPQNEINTPVTISTTTDHSSNVLVDLDDSAKGETAPRAASSAYESGIDEGRETHAGLPKMAPPLPQRRNQAGHDGSTNLEQHPELPRTSVPISEPDANGQIEQRSETYAIRQINWTDATGKIRQSPILAQNENGPCPLLALVNALVLRADEDAQIPIVKALQTREQISLGLLVQALFEELIMCLGPDDKFPDIEVLNEFLKNLDTGMNVNPCLTLKPVENAHGSHQASDGIGGFDQARDNFYQAADGAGGFHKTSDIEGYSTFGIPLIHGWVAEPDTEADAALGRVARYYEDIQLLDFQKKEELENRVLQGGSLSPEEEKTMNDIQTIQQFVYVDNATQLSTFGLDQLRTDLAPGSVSVLFRNNHFSTLYKHPQSHKLYALVTDAGYASHAEIVWESLIDVDGSRAEFFAGDFRPVGGPSEAYGPSSHDAGHSAGQKDQPSQEQSDADYAYALALQFQEEEQRQHSGNNQARDRRASAPYPPGQAQGSTAAPSRSFSTMNRGNSRNPSTSERRSAGRQPPGHTSHSSENDLPPPSYEQAASGRLHNSPQTSSSSVNPDNRYQRNNHGRRAPASSVSALPDRPKDRTKDCVVM